MTKPTIPQPKPGRRDGIVMQKTVVTPAPTAVPGKDPWYRSIFTDHNGDFDMGAVLVGVVALVMCGNSVHDVWLAATPIRFNAQEFGAGIAAMLIGFAAYKYGDAKRPPGTTTTTTEALKP